MTSFTIDAQDKDWTASLEILDANRALISGPYDISDALISVDIDFSELRSGNSLNGWLAWECSVVLSPELSTTVSLGNRDTASNPSGAEVLAMGNRITLSMWTGASYERFWPPFYILREAAPKTDIPINESQAQITIDLGDLGKSLDLFTPENNYSGITQGTTTTPTTLIRNIATQIGLTTSSDTIAGGYSVNTAVQKKSTRSPVREIGEIAAAQKYVAWLDSNEELRLTPADFTLKTAPDFSLTIGIGGDAVGENGWEPVNLDERPPGELTVTGGSDLAQEIENPSVIDRTVPGPGYTSLTSTETKTITPSGGAPETVITYVERQAELQIQPRVLTTDNSGVVPTLLTDADNTNNGLQDSEDSSITHRYNGITKRLTETVELIRKARGLSGGDAFSEEENSSALTLLDNSRTTTTYTYDNILGVVSSRTITERRPWCLWEWGEKTPTNYELNRFLERDYSIQTTTWTRVLDVSGDPAIEAWRVEQVTQQPRGVIFKNYTGANPETLVNNPDPDLTFTLQASDGSTRPPDIEYQESIYTEEHQEFTGSVTVQPISGNAHKWKEGTIRVNADVIVSDRQCNDLAEWAAKWQHGLSLGRSFIGAIPTELFTAFDPVSRVDVTVDGTTEAYFLNGFSISSDLTETLFGCNFGLIGEVGVTPDVVTSPITTITLLTLDIELPALDVDVTAAVVATSLTLDIELPALDADLTISTPTVLTLDVELPALDVDLTASTPTALTLDVELPALDVDLTFIENDPDADNYLAALNGTYTTAQEAAINQFFVTLKSDSTYSGLDRLLILAGQDAADALIDLKTATTVANVVGTGTFTAGTGYTLGDGSVGDAYLGTGFIPSSPANNWAQNSATIFWGTASGLNDSGVTVDIGGRSGSLQDAVFVKADDSAAGTFTINNDNNIPLQNISGTTTIGVHAVQRTAATTTTLYKDGSVVGAQSNTSTGVPTVELWLGGFNNGGSLSFQANQRTYEIVAFGDSTVNVVTLTNAWNTLKTVL